jgi:acyl carrier protein
MRDQVRKVFQEVFEDKELLVTEQTVAADVAKWDSLTHISLILALEEEFGIQFSSQEVASMANVGDLLTFLEAKGVPDGRT